MLGIQTSFFNCSLIFKLKLKLKLCSRNREEKKRTNLTQQLTSIFAHTTTNNRPRFVATNIMKNGFFFELNQPRNQPRLPPTETKTGTNKTIRRTLQHNPSPDWLATNLNWNYFCSCFGWEPQTGAAIASQR